MELIHRSASKQASQIASIKYLQVGTCMRHGQESYEPKTGNEAINFNNVLLMKHYIRFQVNWYT